MRTIDNLKKTAKRWLKALRARDAAAAARLQRAHPRAPAEPGLRDVQHALARERGFESWNELQRAHSAPALEKYARLADDLVAAYDTGDAAAMTRMQQYYGRSFSRDELRAGVRMRLDGFPASVRPAGAFTLPDARLIVAREAGFEDWTTLERGLSARPAAGAPPFASPLIDSAEPLDLTARMIQPVEMRAVLPVKLHGGAITTTTSVWHMLTATLEGDLDRVKASVAASPALVTCDYNYMPPLHLAVREGHADLVRYLAGQNAANPAYVTYPYRETLVTVARDRGLDEIARLLEECYREGDRTRPEDEAGEIDYGMTAAEQRFQKLLNGTDTTSAETMLQERPELARNPFAFWSEGVLMMPANRGHRRMIEMLLRYGARVPDVTKWGSWYYLKNYDIAEFLLDQGMNANHMNCHHTTVLHDMAFKGDVRKATLLLDRGAEVNAIDQEWQSTPLGLAARWGHRDMVTLLLERGADPKAAGAPWATPAEWAAMKGHADLAAMLERAG